jgi:hypothetical protein
MLPAPVLTRQKQKKKERAQQTENRDVITRHAQNGNFQKKAPWKKPAFSLSSPGLRHSPVTTRQSTTTTTASMTALEETTPPPFGLKSVLESRFLFAQQSLRG